VQKHVTEASLKLELTKLQQYFDDVLGITPQVAPWPEAGALSLFLRQGYTCTSTSVLCTEVPRVEGNKLRTVLRKSVRRELYLRRSAGW